MLYLLFTLNCRCYLVLSNSDKKEDRRKLYLFSLACQNNTIDVTINVGHQQHQMTACLGFLGHCSSDLTICDMGFPSGCQK